MSSGSGRDNVGITWPLLRPEAPQPGSIASITATSTPASRKCSALDRPVKPAPITTTSASTAPATAGSFGAGGVTAAQIESAQSTLADCTLIYPGITLGPARLRELDRSG